MLSQPGFDTIGMEPMTAGQVSDLTSNESFIHADGTVGLSGYFVQVFVCDGLLRQSGNGIGRGRTRGVGLILLHELRYYPIQSFLAVDSIAVLHVGRIEESIQQVAKAKRLEVRVGTSASWRSLEHVVKYAG
jgi:hypothetical protein